jgi:hypothetical protein
MANQIEYQSTHLLDLSGWKPELEERFARLETTVAELQRAQSGHATAPNTTLHQAQPPSAAAASGSGVTFSNPLFVADGAIHGPDGRREDIKPGGFPAVILGSPSVPPVKGTHFLQTPTTNDSDMQLVSSQILAGLGSNAPNFPFPPFTGDNPNLWVTLAEQYFAMFAIHESYWVTMGILHFSGAAGIWLQSVRKKIASLDWISFTSLLCTRFGRDHHQLLIRQFYTIKQSSTVADYIERFDILMNHLVSYSDTTHPYYFLTRFIEGLRADIRSVVMVQRPMDLDTACSLALLQEEVAEGEAVSPPRQIEHRYLRFPAKSVQSHMSAATPSPSSKSVDSRGMDSARSSTNQDKITALRNYRRAKGLCFKCGEKWGHEHVCPSTVQMHIVEELWAMF